MHNPSMTPRPSIAYFLEADVSRALREAVIREREDCANLARNYAEAEWKRGNTLLAYEAEFDAARESARTAYALADAIEARGVE